jgi:galactose-1-phosphate uridylyltransferase
MMEADHPWPEPLRRMPDGTVKQINPYSGTSVWTVPGRGNRPLATAAPPPTPIDHALDGRHCAFCAARYFETPPEKARLVADPDGWHLLRQLPAERIADSVAEFRRIPNLFEIVAYDYWRLNYGFQPSGEARAHHDGYQSSERGRAHVAEMVRTRRRAAGMPDSTWEGLSARDRAEAAMSFFAGTHDVIVARRHFVDGATTSDQLASSGTLTPGEHAHYTAFTVEALRSIYEANRYARYVAVFQNWLRPAGASFDHLHKQLVAVDERSVRTEHELRRLRDNLNLYNEYAVDYASRQNLVVAENEAAVAFAGFGHRYPSVEVYSKSEFARPWEQPGDHVRGFSDLLHAVHAATGAEVACNEEWHYQAPDVDLPMPWRVVLKWRVSTLAGFEGGTKIYLNTIDPWNVRDRVVSALFPLRDAGRIAPEIRIATECGCRPNSLRYNPLLRS